MILIEKSSMPYLDHTKITDEEFLVMTNVFSSIGINLSKARGIGCAGELSVLSVKGTAGPILWKNVYKCLEIMCSMGYDDIYIFQINSNSELKILGKFVDIRGML